MTFPKIIEGASKPIKVWTHPEGIEEDAITQLRNTANLPFVFKHLAVMPDVHFGMGATVGSVIATRGAICPAAVGVDIGCGMMAVKTNLDHRIVQDKIATIRHSIERSVPVGFDGNKNISESAYKREVWDMEPPVVIKDDHQLTNKAVSQMGSLGGGNHFIEICLDQDNNVWAMLHSGSRNIGKVTAEHHIDKAKGIMRKMFIDLPDPDLSYFAQETPEFKEYIHDLMWCQQYALENRMEMMDRVIKDLSYAIYGEDGRCERLFEVNCHHNYVAMENHFGSNVLVTRKGAVRAREEDWGIIPGSMGTKSYIVKGRGNLESFCSCSHGAGRRMSRNQARKTFGVHDLYRETKGVECRKDIGVLDEIPSAYKDIDEVVNNQKDLVDVHYVLKQIMCIKG